MWTSYNVILMYLKRKRMYHRAAELQNVEVSFNCLTFYRIETISEIISICLLFYPIAVVCKTNPFGIYETFCKPKWNGTVIICQSLNRECLCSPISKGYLHCITFHPTKTWKFFGLISMDTLAPIQAQFIVSIFIGY